MERYFRACKNMTERNLGSLNESRNPTILFIIIKILLHIFLHTDLAILSIFPDFHIGESHMDLVRI